MSFIDAAKATLDRFRHDRRSSRFMGIGIAVVSAQQEGWSRETFLRYVGELWDAHADRDNGGDEMVELGTLLAAERISALPHEAQQAAIDLLEEWKRRGA